MPQGKPEDKADTRWYQHQPDRVFDIYDSIGFDTLDCNEDYRAKTAFDTIGIAIAKKEISVGYDTYTVIGMVLRSGGYFTEWGNNVWVGDGTKSDYMHEGWYKAANKAIDFLNGYITENDITGDIKLWMAGFSRGGATTNLLAGILDNRICRNQTIFDNDVRLAHNDLYAYTFEAPQGANINSRTVDSPKSHTYDNIWNIVNPNDLVPKIPFSEWGFTRFGTDLYTTTQFYEPDTYAQNRETFRALYENSGQRWSDYKADTLHMESLTSDDNTKVNYDANILEMLVLEQLAKAIGGRGDYNQTLQKGISNALLFFMDETIVNSEYISFILKNLLMFCIFSGPVLMSYRRDSSVFFRWNRSRAPLPAQSSDTAL